MVPETLQIEKIRSAGWTNIDYYKRFVVCVDMVTEIHVRLTEKIRGRDEYNTRSSIYNRYCN